MRLLRIMSQVSFAASCAIAIIVLAFGFKPRLEIQKILSQTSIIEELKKNFGDLPQKDDKEPPLVVQAREFALRIDPPPLIKITHPLLNPDLETRSAAELHDFNSKPLKDPAELKLIGTASYIDHPEKSLALLNLVSGDYKWVRQGEMVDQSIVGEIKDGRIIIYQNEKKYKDLFVPKPQSSLKSLVKN